MNIVIYVEIPHYRTDHFAASINNVSGWIDELERNGCKVSSEITMPELRCVTSRQRELIQLVVLGKTNAQIAFAKKLAVSTVKNCLTDLYEKFHVSSRTELAVIALRHGIVVREI